VFYGLGGRAFAERTALIGAVITACFPSLIFLAGVTLTETSFTFLALLGVLLIVEADARRDWRWLVAAGIVIGVATLVRGQAALLPLVAIPFWWRSTGGDVRATLARVAGVGVLAALVAVPWTARNYVESGSLVVLSSNAGIDFYIGHSEDADGRGRIVEAFVFRYPELPPAEAEARVSRDGFREGIEYAATHPLREVELSARKLFFLYYHDQEALRWTEAHGEREFLSDAGRTTLAALSNVYYYAVLALAVAGIATSVARAGWRHPVRLLLLCIVAYWTLVHIAFFADPRFHAPIMPVVALWAAAGVVVLSTLLRRTRRRGPQISRMDTDASSAT
jgi:4-amino-4-deoxy-L-arabinose transferase-like glycosyltransferase